MNRLKEHSGGIVNENTGNAADPIVTKLANEDQVSWYKKRNLRYLYFMLVPTCMGIQITSGFHAQMVNAMQLLPSWIDCKRPKLDNAPFIRVLTITILQILSIPKAL